MGAPRGLNLGAISMLAPLLGRFGWRGILIVAAIVIASQYIECPGGADQHGAVPPAAEDKAGEEDLVDFTEFVFDDVQASWKDDFEARGKTYQPAGIVLYRQGVSSECGTASSAVGPFYCPLDHKVYLDLSFYGELHRRFGAPGDFAQAYVIGHELGHHVQNQFAALDSRSNQESVQVELQADCLAGVWAKDAERRQLLESGDLREAMDAAAAIGDDKIQEKTTGRIRKESWTHGSSEQRQAAFDRGFQGATLETCGL